VRPTLAWRVRQDADVSYHARLRSSGRCFNILRVRSSTLLSVTMEHGWMSRPLKTLSCDNESCREVGRPFQFQDGVAARHSGT